MPLVVVEAPASVSTKYLNLLTASARLLLSILRNTAYNAEFRKIVENRGNYNKVLLFYPFCAELRKMERSNNARPR